MRSKSVIIFGVFDLLHPGHLAFLEAAAKRGELTVVVTPDAKVKKEKGKKPFFSEGERLAMLSALRCVTKVVLGDKGKDWSVVKKLKPDIICVGHDQDSEHPKFLVQMALLKKKPRVIRISALNPRRYASSRIKVEMHKKA